VTYLFCLGLHKYNNPWVIGFTRINFINVFVMILVCRKYLWYNCHLQGDVLLEVPCIRNDYPIVLLDQNSKMKEWNDKIKTLTTVSVYILFLWWYCFNVDLFKNPMLYYTYKFCSLWLILFKVYTYFCICVCHYFFVFYYKNCLFKKFMLSSLHALKILVFPNKFKCIVKSVSWWSCVEGQFFYTVTQITFPPT